MRAVKVSVDDRRSLNFSLPPPPPPPSNAPVNFFFFGQEREEVSVRNIPALKKD